jgi:hypothetical protein
VTPNTLAERTEYLTSPEDVADSHGFAKVRRFCPDHATLIVRPGRALEVSE